MDESGISLGFDDQIFFEVDSQELLAQMPQLELPDIEFYELRSKTLPPVAESPNFKTEFASSRTQVRQQLQRERILQDEQRKIQQEKLKGVKNAGKPVKVPTNSMAAVPDHVLRVTTTLQHPTKYHILAKRNNQVQQYLSTSITSDDEDMQYVDRSKHAQSAPSVQVIPPNAPPLPSNLSYTNVYSPEVLSPGAASVATSAGTSDAELIEGILSFEEEEGSGLVTQSWFGNHERSSIPKTKTNSCPSDLHQFQQDSDPKDRIRKENHNNVEKRRRYQINDKIKELGELLPRSSDRHYNIMRDNKSNKGTILKASVDYIKVLKDDACKIKVYEVENKNLINQNRHLLLRIKQLEIQAKKNGLQVDNCTWKVADPETILNTIIKTEPGTRTMVHGREVICVSEGCIEDMEDDSVIHKDAMLSSPLSFKSSSSMGSHYNYEDMEMNSSS